MSHDEGLLALIFLLGRTINTPHSSNKIGIGITKDSSGLWNHYEASIETLLCIITTVHRVWFVVACFGHQNVVDATVILLVLIHVVAFVAERIKRCRYKLHEIVYQKPRWTKYCRISSFVFVGPVALKFIVVAYGRRTSTERLRIVKIQRTI
jgi:hypothetical protein